MKPLHLLYLLRGDPPVLAMADAQWQVNSDWFLGHAPAMLQVASFRGERTARILDGYTWLVLVVLEESPKVREAYGSVDLGRLLNTGRRVSREEALAVCPGTKLAEEVN
jgi:hypothetical protein